MDVALQRLPMELIDDHPDNPRLAFRQDVIDAIAANLNGQYPQKHAIHVRPAGGRFQIVSGHHRIRAARQAGLKEVWAWVEPLDDEQALMELVLSNNQGELSPLEIGLHCLNAV
ncbi:MAG: ParB N-terminal domain-containing protein, partial [Chloroflexi bacterium]|nr:ParB N-terminal domain-containing protein [Chloroflexota bacterium]